MSLIAIKVWAPKKINHEIKIILLQAKYDLNDPNFILYYSSIIKIY